ncbi:hypothetical protein [Candidatus Palauibacter sp.]|uniref:hypothetical protein n=1 Tax=Candidatus Palauibacter sp. TaxID=3101350 RepID=UPI003AF280C6
MTRGSVPRAWRTAVVGAGLALSGLAAAVEDGRGQTPRVTIEADTTEIHVGDPLSLRLSVEHPADLSVRWPDSLPLGPFEALVLEVGKPVAEGAGARTPAVLRVTAFELGELELPSFDLELSDGAERRVTVSTDPVEIGVTTVGLDEGGDIRDVKGPRAMALNWLLLWPWILLALALAGLGYWWFRRRRAGPDVDRAVPPEPERPPHEVALEALDLLAASPLLERGEIKRYHIAMSRILRAYLEGRYRIWALEMITPDVISSLGRAGVDPATRTDFQRFLEACDLVKFAKQRPDAGTCRRTLADARELVERTKFVPPAAAEPEPVEAAVP